MRFNEYKETLAEWAKRYGTPSRLRQYNPAERKLCCEKCGKHKNKMARHHKANDFFFAMHLPDVYARRYLEFRPEDIAKLCSHCHTNIERYSKKLKEKLYADFALRNKTDGILDVRWAEFWRQEFLNLYMKWIAIPKRRKKR